MPQNRPLYQRFTAADMLRLGAKLNPRWDAAAAAERLRRRGIPPDRRVRTLSGGQQAQVSLALALGKRPELLLLDEPASNLDPLARREFLSELVDAAAGEGVSVVLSSHMLADIERACDHLVILSQGRVQVAGDIDSLLAAHRILIGPRTDSIPAPAQGTAIRTSHFGRESAFLLRSPAGAPPAGWRSEPVGLEELVLAYLENPNAGGIPSPVLVQALGR